MESSSYIGHSTARTDCRTAQVPTTRSVQKNGGAGELHHRQNTHGIHGIYMVLHGITWYTLGIHGLH